MKRPTGLSSGVAILAHMEAYPPSKLTATPAGRVAQIIDLLIGAPVVDDEGHLTGEYMPLISKSMARRLLAQTDAEPILKAPARPKGRSRR